MTDGDLSIEGALEVFLPRTQSLCLTRTLHRKLKDSLVKSDRATDRRTRAGHGARVMAFLAGCRSYSDLPQMQRCFEVAFPKEVKIAHFVEAARLLRNLLVDEASRLRLPAVTNQGVHPRAPVPSSEQLLRTVKAIEPIRATEEMTSGHPLLAQTIRRHGWSRMHVEEAFIRIGYDRAVAERYCRTFAKNGAFESVT